MDISIDLFIKNCDIKFDINLNAAFDRDVSAGVSFAFDIDLSLAGEFNYGHAVLPRLHSFGGVIPAGYGYSNNTLKRMTSFGSGGMYVPPDPQYGFAFLPYFTSFGIIKTSKSGTGSAMCKSLISKGGVSGYGEASSSIKKLVSIGKEGYPPNTAYAVEDCLIFSGTFTAQDFLFILNETGNIVTTFTGSREVIGDLATALQIQSTIDTQGDYIASLLIGLTVTDDVMNILNETIGFDPTARVWAVNLDTGASSQYDYYGFTSFFQRGEYYYGIASDGIYRLDGLTDAGSNIIFELEVGNSNYGTYKFKKSSRVYSGYSADGQMLLKVICDGVENIYLADEGLPSMSSHKFRLSERGAGTKGTFWNLKLLNTNGCQVEMHNIEFKLVGKSRRIE